MPTRRGAEGRRRRMVAGAIAQGAPARLDPGSDDPLMHRERIGSGDDMTNRAFLAAGACALPMRRRRPRQPAPTCAPRRATSSRRSSPSRLRQASARCRDGRVPRGQVPGRAVSRRTTSTSYRSATRRRSSCAIAAPARAASRSCSWRTWTSSTAKPRGLAARSVHAGRGERLLLRPRHARHQVGGRAAHGDVPAPQAGEVRADARPDDRFLRRRGDDDGHGEELARSTATSSTRSSR